MALVVESFWKNKKVFLTGHTGFKGSWLSLWLTKMGADVTGFALKPPTNPSLFDDAKIHEIIRSHIGDIRDVESLKQALVSSKAEIVIHMAAQPLVRYSYANPIETYMTNVMGTVHLFEAVKAAGSVRAVVNVTSDKCYENKEWDWGYREDEPMGGFDPYSNSKGCSELVTASYRQSFFGSKNKNSVSLGSGRAGNVIGGGDWALDRLIPDIVRALGKGEPVKIRNPKSIRPWQHVLEPLSGYLVLAQQLFENGDKVSQGFNFGPDDSDAKEVLWIVQQMTAKWGPKATYKIVEDANAVHEAHYLKLDCSKAKAVLGWTPRWNLEKTIDSIIDWNQNYLESPSRSRDLTLGQIERYQNQK